MLHVELNVNEAENTMQANILPFYTPTAPRWVQKVKLFQNMVMLHIKLKGIKRGIKHTYSALLYTHGPTGPRSAVGNVSGYRCVSDCRSRGREFDPGPVPYFRGD